MGNGKPLATKGDNVVHQTKSGCVETGTTAVTDPHDQIKGLYGQPANGKSDHQKNEHFDHLKTKKVIKL